jgi:UPF0271 protein
MRITTIDLNADLGEGMPGDRDMLAIVTSANIACGYHAGDERSMIAAVRSASRNRVAIGAHPGLADRANFGRKAMPLTPPQVTALVTSQVETLAQVAAAQGARIAHIKPHGALYWMAEASDDTANAIIDALLAHDPALRLFCRAGGRVASIAAARGVATVEEIFADRAYTAAGNLVARPHIGAIISDPDAAARRILAWTESGEIEAIDGSVLALRADTVCVHGDEPSAVATARLLRHMLEAKGISVARPKAKE